MLSEDQQQVDAPAAIPAPWTLRERVGMVLWEYVWYLLCAWTPKPLNPWRLLWLRVFGGRVLGTPFVHQRARIQIPWHVTLHHGCCIGDRANLYSLGEIEVGSGAVVAQEVYLCTGTHDFSDPGLELITSKVSIGKGAFIGARAFVLPGVTIGESAIVGACAVVTADVAPFTVNAGNPCRFLKRREDAPKMADSIQAV